jgi:hypothetical protein
MFVKNAPQMPCAHSEAHCKRRYSVITKDSRFDLLYCGGRKLIGGVNWGVTGSQLRATAETRPISRNFRGSCMPEKLAVHQSRFFRWTNRSAIDSGRTHGNEESAVESCIARNDRSVTLLAVKIHVEKLIHSKEPVSPFSDMKFSRRMISFANDLRT